MSKFIGRQVALYIGRESTRGVGVAPTFKVPKVLFDHDLKATTVVNQAGYGGIWEGNQGLVATKWAEGVLETEFYSRSMGVFLYALLGSLSTSGPSDSAYTHTFSLQNDILHDSLSLFATDPNKTEQFEMSMIESMEITIVPDDLVKVSIEFASKPPTDTSEPVGVSYVAESKFLGRHASVKLAALTGDLAAASKLSGVKEFTIRIAKNLQKNFVLGTVSPEDINNRKFEITGTITMDFTADTYRDFFEAGTYRALRLNLNNVDALIGATSTPQFTLDLSRIFIEAWEREIPIDEIATETLTFRALYDLTNGNVINSCTLVNNTASYS